MGLEQVRPIRRIGPGSAQKRNHKFNIFPAPVKGLSTSETLVTQDPQTALLLDNVFIRRYGNETRPGYLRWNSNLGGLGTPSPVLSVMSYYPPRGSGSPFQAKLFAACGDGNIYEVQDRHNEAFVPPIAVSIPGQLVPGQFSWTNYATLATNFLCICSAGGGYWTYDHVGGWINRTGAITGPGAGAAINFDFIMSWKNRLWFIQNNTTDAWFLPTNAIAGNASNFDFGPLFVHGGDLKAMASWTLDSGAGVDDKLVIAADSGDVLIYEGTDPVSAATFRIVGRWYTGRPPAGRRFLSKYGGDLAMVTEVGIEYMSRMIQGHSLLDPQTAEDQADVSRRFNEVIGEDVRNTRNQTSWNIVSLVSEQCIYIVTPHNIRASAYQYCFATMARGWSRMTKMPMSCAEEHLSDLYFGTLNGTIHKAFYGESDDELMDGTPGNSIQADIQTAFIAPNDERMELKRPLLCMPMFMSSAPPQVKIRINTEWSRVGTPGSPPYAPNADAKWDLAKWGQAVWGGADNTYLVWTGVDGLGIFMSLRLSLVAAPRTVFTSWKIVYESGGIM